MAVNGPKGLNWSYIFFNIFLKIQNIPNLVKFGQKYLKIVRNSINGLKWFKMVTNCQKGLKHSHMVQHGKKWSKMVNNSPK